MNKSNYIKTPPANYSKKEFPFLDNFFFRKTNFNFKRGLMETISAEKGKISQIVSFTYYFLLLSSIIVLIFT